MACSRTRWQGKLLLTQWFWTQRMQLLLAEALIPCSTKVIQERLLNNKKRQLTSDPQEIWVFKSGICSTARDTASVDNCHRDILKHFDSCKHPPLENLIKIKLVSCAP